MTLEQLAALQVAFVQALDAPPATAQLPHGWFEGRAQDWRRFSRYRNGLWQHQAQSLKLTYPVLTALAGEEFLHCLACDYGRAHPSRHPDLSLFGEQLATFLADYPGTVDYPYFAEMAELEWAVHCCARAAETVCLNAPALAGMSGGQVSTLRLALSPGCMLLPSEWPTAAVWQAHVEQAATLPALRRGRCFTLVYRQGWQVKVRPVEPDEAAALSLFSTTATLGEALLAAQTQRADACSAAPTMIDSAALLRRWLNEALLVVVED